MGVKSGLVANDPILTSPSPSVTWIRKSMSPSPWGLDMFWYWKNSHLPVAGVNSSRKTRLPPASLPSRVLVPLEVMEMAEPEAVRKPFSKVAGSSTSAMEPLPSAPHCGVTVPEP
ncbi:hypothetical protein D3C72_889560 [compost metagenome]